MADRYDVVVIGAGLGGLTAAALLAQAGRSVLVIERNPSVGGAASTYKSGDLLIEGALHETGDARNPIDPKHSVLARIGILDAVEWVPTGALYEVRGGPVGAAFVLPDSFAGARAALTQRFPHARDGIASLLGDLERVAAMEDDPIGSDGCSSLAEVFDKTFGNDEGVKCALAANLAYYHDDPRSLGWLSYAAVQGGCLAAGSRFIRGGSQRLSNAFRRAIQNAGGRFLFKRKVTEIRIGIDGRPASLVHTNREGGDPVEVAVTTVVGNAPPAALTTMLSATAQPKFGAAYASRPLSTSLFAATVGLSRPPAEFGLRSYSTILLPDWMQWLNDYPRGAALVRTMPHGDVPVLTIANYSAIDSGLGGPPFPVSVLGVDRFENWSGLTEELYNEQRARVLDGIMAAVEREFPGFASHVVAKSLNTANSMSSYLNATQGAVYGFAPEAYHSGSTERRSPQTPVPGLYLASAYTSSGGFTGAIIGGASAADCILAGG